jgi:hypothetical protein
MSGSQFTTSPAPVYRVTGYELPSLDCGGDMCSQCSGSGEGMYDGATCGVCGGTGEVGGWPIFDEPDGLDDDAFDDYMCDAYESAVA